MNKMTLIIVIVVVLLLLTGAFIFMKKSSSNPKTAQGQTAQGPQKKSLLDFFSMTGSLKCTFADKTANSSGTVYAAVGKMRGDFQSAVNGTTTQSHMVNDGSYVYIWTDGQKTGYKMSLASVKSEASQAISKMQNGPGPQQSSSQGMDMKKQSDYSCGPWAADNSLFTPPTDVTFTDYTSMMQGAMHGVTPPAQGMSSQQKSSECQQCNQVPAGAMRNQCLSALKCQ